MSNEGPTFARSINLIQVSDVETHIPAQFKLTAEFGPMFVLLATARHFIQPQAGFGVFTLASRQQLVNEMQGQSVAIGYPEWGEWLIAATDPTAITVRHVHVELPLP